MSVVATVAVGSGDVLLGATLAADPDLTVTLESVVPLGDRFVPYVWVADGTDASVERALGAETDVESFAVLDRVGDRTLVRVDWPADRAGLFGALADTEATLLEAVGEGGTWTLRLRFDDRADLAAFFERCREEGVPVDLQRVDDVGRPEATGLRAHVTDAQYETLVAALENGYFEVPRRIDLGGLADELGVSDTAVSQRLRRGVESLLAATLAGEGEGRPAAGRDDDGKGGDGKGGDGT